MCKIKKSAFVILSICVALIIFGGGKVSFIVFYMLTGSIILSYILGRIEINKIVVNQKPEKEEYFSGDKVAIISNIINKSILPIPYLEITDRTRDILSKKYSKSYINFIMPMQKSTFSDKFEVNYRGIYRIGPTDLKCIDLLGFIEWNKQLYSDSYIKIYPRYYTINKFLTKSFNKYGTFAHNNRLYEDNSKISDIKKYSPGDSIRKIHWKMSAKKGQLQVKNFEFYSSSCLYIFLDFNNRCFTGIDGRDSEERAVETATTIAYFSLNKHIPLKLYINTMQLDYAEGKSCNDFKRILNLLTIVKPDGNIDVLSLIENRINTLNKQSPIVIITGLINSLNIEKLCFIKRNGYDLVVVYVSNKKAEYEVAKKFDDLLITFVQIDKDTDIKEVLESI